MRFISCCIKLRHCNQSILSLRCSLLTNLIQFQTMVLLFSKFNYLTVTSAQWNLFPLNVNFCITKKKREKKMRKTLSAYIFVEFLRDLISASAFKSHETCLRGNNILFVGFSVVFTIILIQYRQMYFVSFLYTYCFYHLLFIIKCWQ